MRQKFQSGVLRRVKNTFHKMTFKYNNLASSATSHPITTINIAPQFGRRDAAFDQAILLLKSKIFSYSENNRMIIYNYILELLGECIKTSKHICNPSSGHKRQNEEGILQYLILLNDTVQAAATMLLQQQTIVEDETTVSNFIGTDMFSQFQDADEILANSEMNLYQCITEMLEASLRKVMQYREYCTKTFPRKDLKRYHKAFVEFQRLYLTKYSTVGLKPTSPTNLD